jgi:hypothetical protein
MGKNRSKHGVSVVGPWLALPLEFLRSRACAELSPLAAKLLLDLLALLGPNATRNGDLSLAPKIMAIRGWTSRSSLAAAVRELLAHGLLEQTRQGSRLDCNLYAVTLYPLSCDLSKLDVKPGTYLFTDYMGDGTSLANPPVAVNPAQWRRARKSQKVAPLRDDVQAKRPATGQTHPTEIVKQPTLYRYGTKPPVFGVACVPPRVTYID